MRTQSRLHQKQRISLAEALLKESSLDTKTIVGVNLEHCQKDDLTTGLFLWAMNLWSSVDTIPGNLVATCNCV